MMNKDKELLLPIKLSNSESDDVVEEYKLPPPRARRPRVRKAVAEARIASSSFCTWKCCFTFFLVSIFISALLVVSFFMLSMQSEINELRGRIEKAYAQIDQNSAMEASSKKLMAKLDEYKLKFSKQDLNNKLLAHQIQLLNKTVKKSTSSKTVVVKDVDLLKSGMATTGGDIAKIQSKLSEHSDQMESVLIELKSVKIALYNVSAKNPAALKKLIQPISAQTQAIGKLRNVIHRINRTHSAHVKKLANRIYENSVEIDKYWSMAKAMVDSLNTTHIADFLKLGKYIAINKNTTDNNIGKYTTANLNSILHLTNITNTLKDKVEHHHEKMKNYEKSTTSNSNSILLWKNISKALKDQVDNHHDLLKNYKNLSSLYGEDIAQLEEDSKRFDVTLNAHSALLQNYGKEIKSLTKGSSVATKVNTSTISAATSKATILKSEAKTKEPLAMTLTSSASSASTASPDTSSTSPITGKSEETTSSSASATIVKSEEMTQSSTSSIIMKSEETTLPPTASITLKSEVTTPSLLPALTLKPEEKTEPENITMNQIKRDSEVPSKCQEEARVPSMPGRFIPQCDDDGKYKKKQCHGSTGHCWCVSLTGVEVPGSRKGPTEDDPNCDSGEVCPLTCEVAEHCVNTDTGFKCVCATGFIFGGKFCADVDECSESNHCHPNAYCENTFGSYTCTCKDGFHGNGTHCQSKASVDHCQLKAEIGLCRAYFERYFYNSTSSKCEKFVFGGCGGNDNNFETLTECTASCATAQNATVPQHQPNGTSHVTNTTNTFVSNITAKPSTESKILFSSTKSTIAGGAADKKSSTQSATKIAEEGSPEATSIDELDTDEPTTEPFLAPEVPNESKVFDFNKLAEKTLRDQKARDEQAKDYTNFRSVGKDKTGVDDDEAQDLNTLTE